MAKDKVLILRWAGSAYDSLGGLLELTARELLAAGINVSILTCDDNDWTSRLLLALNQDDLAFALTLSGIGADLTLDGKLIWEVKKVPLFNWSCDHPCYYPVRHAIRSQYLIHGYVFPDHARYNARHLNPNGAAFAVHLGIPPRTLFPAAPVPAARRNGRLMFTKSGKDINKIEEAWRSYALDMRHILFVAAEELFTRSTGDFFPILQRIAEPRGIFLNGNSRLTMRLIQELDGYIRFKRGNLVMQTVLRYPVDVCGSGWEHIKWDGAAAQFRGSMAWNAMLGELPAYTGCLSINPLIEESVHDRVLFALAAAVPPVTDANEFSRTYMPDLVDYTFDFTRDRIEQAVDALLADPVGAIERTEATWQSLAVPFGIRRSARQIVQFATLHALNSQTGA